MSKIESFEVSSGSGLGLSVYHDSNTEHGGRIYAESKPGRGATSIIEPPSQKKAAGNIIIVDNEPLIRNILARILSDKGHQAQVVSNGKAALAKLAKNVYDLLIVDLKMSGLSGRELYEIMKKSHPNMAKRVVFITGDVVTADTHDFLVSTGKPYLSKLFNPREIIDIIEKALGKI
ncbi:MAG: response regulator [Chloroflexi bacterium]|nr:response regulator [Chloroflexota bacterium]